MSKKYNFTGEIYEKGKHVITEDNFGVSVENDGEGNVKLTAVDNLMIGDYDVATHSADTNAHGDIREQVAELEAGAAYIDATDNENVEGDSDIRAAVADLLTYEPWVFKYPDGSTVTKQIYTGSLSNENMTFVLKDGTTVTKGVYVK